jgi:hypothetical protein
VKEGRFLSISEDWRRPNAFGWGWPINLARLFGRKSKR